MKKALAGMAVLGVLGLAGFLFFKKVQHDRRALLAYTPHEPRMTVTTQTKDGKQTVTYTQKELDEMRKKGKLPAGAKQTTLPATNAGEDATQRALKTVNEINRINEMNRQLMEQQERMRRQQK